LPAQGSLWGPPLSASEGAGLFQGIISDCISLPAPAAFALSLAYRRHSWYIQNMTGEEKYTYWRELAQYDLESAEAMYNSGRWFYVVFMCQQAVEKLCKGLYNFYIDDNVPKIHTIRFLFSKIEAALAITIPAETYSLADALSAHYLDTRYPDFTGRPGLQVNEEKAKNFLQRTKEVYRWLLTLKQ
jgi:HEPN domain-containing protein